MTWLILEPKKILSMWTAQVTSHVLSQPVRQKLKKFSSVLQIYYDCFRYAVKKICIFLINATTCTLVELLGPCFKTGRIDTSVIRNQKISNVSIAYHANKLLRSSSPCVKYTKDALSVCTSLTVKYFETVLLYFHYIFIIYFFKKCF